MGSDGRSLILFINDNVNCGSGTSPEIENLIKSVRQHAFIVDGYLVCPKDEQHIRAALNTAVIGGIDLVITIGGDQIDERDNVPDVTEKLLDTKIVAINETLRAYARDKDDRPAAISRGVTGISGGTVITNFPGTLENLVEYFNAVIPFLTYLTDRVQMF